MSDRAWVLKYPLKCDKVQWLQTHCGQAWISLGKSLYKDILFLCPQWSSGPYISRNFLIWTHFVNASWKKSDLRTHISSTTQGNKHALITMMYFSRKLNNNKVITKVCNFWRQIACSFQVYGHTNHHNFCATSTRKTLFWISGFFSPDQHWRHKLFLPTIFPTARRR